MNGVDIFANLVKYINNHDVNGFEKFVNGLTEEENKEYDKFNKRVDFAYDYLNR